MAITVQEVKEFLKNNSYAIIITGLEDGCKVEFPDKKSAPQIDTKTVVFKYEDGSMYCNNYAQKKPEYAFRLITSCFILKWCSHLGYHSKYLILNDKDDKEIFNGDILDVIPQPNDKEQKEKDEILINIFCEAWPTLFHESFDALAKECDVLEGYELVKQIFLEGKDE